MHPLGVGVVGCGNISDIYLTNLQSYQGTEVVGVADLDAAKAQAQGAKHDVPVQSVDELFANDAVDLVLNLTVPNAHHAVAKRALQSGKHAYNEKPVALTRDEGAELVTLAVNGDLRLGGAPDTFLGGGIQTCIQLINEGVIGEVVAGQAFMMGHGPEGWHPNPEFYYEVGGGPMFDMGPYYLTALVAILGSIRQVSGLTRKTFSTRTIGSEAKRGKVIPVAIPTHVIGLLEFDKAVVELTTSFDVWAHTFPPITLHGSEGSLMVGDPNAFGDTVMIRKSNESDWSEVAPTHTYTQNSRGVGVLDIAYALEEKRPHRTSAELVYHVLDVMQAIHDAAELGTVLKVKSSVAKPAPMPANGLE